MPAYRFPRTVLKHGLLKKQGKSGAYFERYAVRKSNICACGACWQQLHGMHVFCVSSNDVHAVLACSSNVLWVLS